MSNLDRSPALAVSERADRVSPQPAHEVLPASEVDLGEGTPVRRLLPKRRRSTIGAWCFFDHFGPLDVASGPGMRVPPHPHTSLQTVTWLIEGDVFHRDSLGNEQLILPGQLNLMTAGRGIAHAEESPPDHRPVLHGAQLWTVLPSRSKDVEPAFDHHPELPVAQTKGGLRVTVLLGQLFEERSPARTYSEIVGADVDIRDAADDEISLRPDFEYGVAALTGEVSVDGSPLEVGGLLYLGGQRRRIKVRSAGPARFLLLGGEPFGEPLFMWWNFVAHSADEIAEFRADWEAGRRFGEVRGFDGARLDAPPMMPGRLKPRG
jgi:redox-sensitive bicupin YhaK (pirin superfamily)